LQTHPLAELEIGIHSMRSAGSETKAIPTKRLKREFKRRGPWVTRFDIEGISYGGAYHAEADDRLRRFFELFPNPGRVLELGCLEGGHTFPLARIAREVVAIDARTDNLDRARWLQHDVMRRPNISFLQADLEHFDLSVLGPFDVTFNVGLLYHLPEPWVLLERLAPVTRAMFLWTHVAAAHHACVEDNGYWGMPYAEGGPADPLSGTSRLSFWPTLESLREMLGNSGFDEGVVLEMDEDHIHGPAVLMSCRSRLADNVGGWKSQWT
jgi:SAM-dependent methyltransferase